MRRTKQLSARHLYQRQLHHTPARGAYGMTSHHNDNKLFIRLVWCNADAIARMTALNRHHNDVLTNNQTGAMLNINAINQTCVALRNNAGIRKPNIIMCLE